MSIGDAYDVHGTINHFDDNIDVNVYVESSGTGIVYMHNYNKTTDSWHSVINKIHFYLYFFYDFVTVEHKFLYVN